METVLERIRREYPATKKMFPPDPDKIKRDLDEELDSARAWIKVAQIRGRPLSAREQESLNI